MLPLSNSMRNNYAAGVAEYYTRHASSTYRNPHYPGILKTLLTFLDAFADASQSTKTDWHVLDMAAGSGEVTEALLTWQKRRQARKLGCPALQIVATDPYTSPAYVARTGLECLPLSFSEITEGSLPSSPEIYDLTICSFALHLLTETSQLWALLSILALRSTHLVVLAPHKKPAIKQEWGWIRIDPWTMREICDTKRMQDVGGKRGDGWEIYEERVRLRVYKSSSIGYGQFKHKYT